MEHAEAVAAARAFQERSGALRVVLIVDRGDEEPLMVDCDQTGEVELTEGETLRVIAAGEDAGAVPGMLPDVRAVPATAISMDTVTGELAAPLGAIEHLARALLELATALGGRSVATAEIATQGEPITLAARPGEPVVLAAGEDEYRLPG
jgi:hypothetical protein